MKKNVLIFSIGNNAYFTLVEEALACLGFQVIYVKKVRECVFRLDNDFFSCLICEDDDLGTRQRELARAVSRSPFAMTTPSVVIGSSPVPSDQSLLTSVLDQYFQNTTEPQMIAEFIEETLSLRTQKVKRGAIRSMPVMLCQAARLRFSGALVMERGEEKCVIYFEHGYVVFASSNQNAHRFGEFLLSQNVINREQLTQALVTLKNSKKRLGRILVDSGFLKPQLLQTLLQSQIKHIVLNVFDWTEGEFYILVEEPLDPENAIARAAIGPLLLEGVRYRFDEARLSREFEPFDSKVSLALPLEQLKKRVHLGKNEIDFLALVGSGRPINDLLSLNSYSRREVLSLLYAFRLLGFLAFEAGAYAPAPLFPTKSEKDRVLEELFEKKAHSKTQGPPSRMAPEVVVVTPTSRLPYIAGATTMVLAIAILLTVFTLFDTRSSRDAQSDARQVARESAGSARSDLIIISPIPLDRKEFPVAVSSPSPLPTPEPTQAPSKVAEIIPSPTPEVHVAMRTPGFSDHLRSARQKKARGLLREALKSYEAAYALNWTQSEMLLEMADLYFELDDMRRAIEYYEKVKRSDPANARPYLALGTIFLLQDNQEEARRSYEAYLAVVEPNEKTQPRINEVRRILRTMGR